MTTLEDRQDMGELVRQLAGCIPWDHSAQMAHSLSPWSYSTGISIPEYLNPIFGAKHGPNVRNMGEPAPGSTRSLPLARHRPHGRPLPRLLPHPRSPPRAEEDAPSTPIPPSRTIPTPWNAYASARRPTSPHTHRRLGPPRIARRPHPPPSLRVRARHGQPRWHHPTRN